MTPIFIRSLALLLPATLSFSSIIVMADPAAEKLLQKADSIRNPAKDFRMSIDVESSENTTEFEVSLKGTDKTLIVTKKPAKDRGRNMLMIDRDFYAYVPNLKRSVRLSLAQKLSGQVANGDISRTRWYGDYDAAFENKTTQESVLLLTGRKEGLTYAKIRLWIENKTGRPLRAEYLSLNGKTLLKKASFEDYKNLAGAERPSTVKIQDTNGQVSFIRIRSMEAKPLSDSLFTERNMETAR